MRSMTLILPSALLASAAFLTQGCPGESENSASEDELSATTQGLSGLTCANAVNDDHAFCANQFLFYWNNFGDGTAVAASCSRPLCSGDRWLCGDLRQDRRDRRRVRVPGQPGPGEPVGRPHGSGDRAVVAEQGLERKAVEDFHFGVDVTQSAERIRVVFAQGVHCHRVRLGVRYLAEAAVGIVNGRCRIGFQSVGPEVAFEAGVFRDRNTVVMRLRNNEVGTQFQAVVEELARTVETARNTLDTAVEMIPS